MTPHLHQHDMIPDWALWIMALGFTAIALYLIVYG